MIDDDYSYTTVLHSLSVRRLSHDRMSIVSLCIILAKLALVLISFVFLDFF